MQATTRAPRVRNALGLAAVASMIVGPLLAWLRLVPAIAGFGLFALGGITAVLTGVTSLVQAVRGRGLSRGGGLALAAAVVFVLAARRGAGVPAINDFTTDMSDPPVFRHATTLPANVGRDMGYPPSFAEIQRTCCADLGPARLTVSGEDAFRRALETAEHMPTWTVTTTDPASGTIEAVATSRLFGFQDDIVIRVRPGEGGASRIDMRSKSRDGRGDLGANAARIRAYLAALQGSPLAHP
jgi:uncharacterized protein (DUF1499 family)